MLRGSSVEDGLLWDAKCTSEEQIGDKWIVFGVSEPKGRGQVMWISSLYALNTSD